MKIHDAKRRSDVVVSHASLNNKDLRLQLLVRILNLFNHLDLMWKRRRRGKLMFCPHVTHHLQKRPDLCQIVTKKTICSYFYAFFFLWKLVTLNSNLKQILTVDNQTVFSCGRPNTINFPIWITVQIRSSRKKKLQTPAPLVNWSFESVLGIKIIFLHSNVIRTINKNLRLGLLLFLQNFKSVKLKSFSSSAPFRWINTHYNIQHHLTGVQHRQPALQLQEAQK